MARIFEQEISLQRTLEHHREDLSQRYDFNVADAFYLIQPQGPEMRADYYDLNNFIKNNGEIMPEEDVMSILRRYDKDGDAKISF